MIPDDPTYESIAGVLEMMTVRYCKSMWMTNLAEWQRLRGTPGEPVPRYDVGFCMVIVFYGGAVEAEDELWILKAAHIDRMQRGETVYFRAKGMDTRAVGIGKAVFTPGPSQHR